MKAYWEEALNIGDPGVLADLADELGLVGAEAAIVGRLHADDVEQSTARAHSVGIDAIPAYVLDQRLIVLGAQPDEVFVQAFAQLGSATEETAADDGP